jgi:tetratricopeptide (TPR) repeat protein
MPERLEHEWLWGRATLGVAAGWTVEEMRLVADLGYALAEQGRDWEALIIFEGLATLAPATAYFHSALGALWLRLDEPRRAVEHLNKALGADSHDFNALLNRGEAFLHLGEHAAAKRDLSAAVAIAGSTPVEGEAPGTARARALLARLGSAGGE